MHTSEIVHLLRTQGYRITRQRLVIIDAISQHGQHFTAEELHEFVKAHDPAIDLATIYRSLHLLHTVGLLRRFSMDAERLAWEAATDTVHHHLICRECGTEQEINNHVIESLQEHILHHYNFDADPDHLAIFGRCAGCRPPEPAPHLIHRTT